MVGSLSKEQELVVTRASVTTRCIASDSSTAARLRDAAKPTTIFSALASGAYPWFKNWETNHGERMERDAKASRGL